MSVVRVPAPQSLHRTAALFRAGTQRPVPPRDAATPLKCAKAPSPCRKKRSIGIMRSIEFISVGDGTIERAIRA